MCIFDGKYNDMHHLKPVLPSFFLFLLFLGCERPLTDTKAVAVIVEQMIDSLRERHAPDRRVAVFDVDLVHKEGKFVITGETDQPAALQSLKKDLAQKDIDVRDSVVLLPHPSLGDSLQAVVTISVANLRSAPKHSAELATQATLGTPVKVLKKEGSWYYIQTPDGYLAWVDNGGISVMDPERFAVWQANEKVIYTQTYGHAYFFEDDQEPVSDLVAGAVLEVVKYGAQHYIVAFPDGRNAFVRQSEAMMYQDWLNDLDPKAENLVATSKQLMGIPYLWGGTSTKGADCSGFTKTVYFLNGIVLPRDASQQVHAGQPIDSVGDFSHLEAGDLLFFGRRATDTTRQKVVHVGMWIGNNEFIHASDRVRISSMDENSPLYDAYNKGRYLRTQRMLHQKDQLLMELAQTPLFKD